MAKTARKKNSERKIITSKEGWPIIRKGIAKLRNIVERVEGCEQFNAEEYVELYTTTHIMCMQEPPHTYAFELFDLYKESLEEYLTATVLPALRRPLHDDELILKEVVRRWENYKEMFKRLSHIFGNLDPCFPEICILRYHGISRTAIMCFRELVYHQVRDNVKNSAIAVIDKEREGEQIDRPLLRKLLLSIQEMGHYNMNFEYCYSSNTFTYIEDYEGPVLEGTVAYYSRKAASWLVEYSCPAYMVKVEQCLKHEKEVVAQFYLESKGSWGEDQDQKLLDKVENTLLSVYGIHLLRKEHLGCRALFREESIDDLSRMYRLFGKIPNALELIVNTFSEHVTREGTTVLKQEEDAFSHNVGATEADQLRIMRKLIELQDKYWKYVEDVFQNDPLFDKALNEAFSLFCNSKVAGGTSAVELLVTYCHNVLTKGGAKKLGHGDIEGTLEKLGKFLACVYDKDIFFESYREKLGRRLLFDTSANEDHERIMLLEIKRLCGRQYSSKMEGMLQDLTSTREENENNFKAFLDNNPNVHLEIDFTVKVLNTGFWPRYRSSEINLPSDLVKCVDLFEKFYHTQTKPRKLRWIHSMGICDVIGWFGAKLPVEMTVTTHQAAVLLLFNNSAKLSYSDIQLQLNLQNEDLVPLLHSLSSGKYKILFKQGNNTTVSTADNFTFNSKFRSRKMKIKVPFREEKKAPEEKAVEHSERSYLIDCKIVHIMKHQKVLHEEELVLECIERVKMIFKPEKTAINKEIEELITREILVRDQENSHILIYLP